jgi:hypothetical protein
MKPSCIAPLILAIFAASHAFAEATDSKSDQLRGRAVIIHAKTGGNSGPTPTANVGGLLIVQISDSGSRPPQNMSVEAGRTFEPLGKLRGIRTDEKSGRPLMGGGYTWFLFKPTNKSDTETIEVKFTPAEGKPITQKLTVKVSDKE